VAIGPFGVEDAGRELTAAEALGFMPELRLDAEEARAVSQGQSIVTSHSSLVPQPASEAERLATGDERLVVSLTFEGELLAVARLEGEHLKPEVVLA
jgi:hypothetical protein